MLQYTCGLQSEEQRVYNDLSHAITQHGNGAHAEQSNMGCKGFSCILHIKSVSVYHLTAAATSAAGLLARTGQLHNYCCRQHTVAAHIHSDVLCANM